MKSAQHNLALLLFTILGVALLGTSFAAEPPAEPKWIAFSGTFINLNEVIKIEVDGEKLTFIAPARKVVYQADSVRKEVMNRLRALLKDSPNWVEISKTRGENQEWYANLARVPSVFYGTAPGNTMAAVLFWPGGDLADFDSYIGIISNNEAATKLLQYVSRAGYSMDRDANGK